MGIGRFRDSQELLAHATAFVGERTNSLLLDVGHCLQLTAAGSCAPFPAVLYCFATIDLFGALYAGNASRGAHPTLNAARYMRDVMEYTDEEVDLLQRLFRHKLVHLAQPAPVVAMDDGRHVSWRYRHEPDPRHLQISRLSPGVAVQAPTWQVPADHEFCLSISMFADEIGASVPQRYLPRLEGEAVLQDRFARAIGQIYDPAQ
jgi:hypothetical protein